MSKSLCLQRAVLPGVCYNYDLILVDIIIKLKHKNQCGNLKKDPSMKTQILRQLNKHCYMVIQQSHGFGIIQKVYR